MKCWITPFFILVLAGATATRPVDPQSIAKAEADLDAVESLLNQNDRDAAIRRFTTIPADANQDRDFAKHVTQVRARVNEAADAMLKDVDDQLAANKIAPAARRLRELLSVMAGLPTASLARQHLAELVSRADVQHEIELAERREKAQRALDAARDLRDAGEVEQAYAAFKSVASDYANTPAGDAAAEAVKAYESDSRFQHHRREAAAAPKAKPALVMAENYAAAGRIDLAKTKYQEIIDTFPETSFAQTAREELEKLK